MDTNQSEILPNLPEFTEDASEYRDDSRILMSPSSVISYMADPAKYYFKKILKRTEPARPQRVEGTAYHAVVEYAMEHKKQTGTLPPLDRAIKYLETLWDAEMKKIDPTLRPGGERLEYVKKFLPLIYDHLSTVTPKLIEQYVRRPVPQENFDIHGYIDLVHTKFPGAYKGFDPRTDIVTDYKSKAMSPPKDADGNYSMSNYDRLQLTLYAWALSAGNYTVTSEIVYFVKTKSPKIVTVREKITPEDQRRRLRTVKHIVTAIQNKVFTPNYGGWGCSPDKCAFWKECHDLF